MPTALVIDDDIVIQIAIQDFLEESGFTILEALDAEKGVALFTEQLPDIVLLDVEMPKIDGFEACRQLRSLPGGLHIPIVMMTGHEDPDSVDKAYESGATDFVSKPMNFPILVHRLQHLLRTAETAEQLRRSQASLAKAQRIAKLGSWELDVETMRFECTEETSRLIKNPSFQKTMSFADLVSNICAEERDEYTRAFDTALQSSEDYDITFRLLDADGVETYIHQDTFMERNKSGTVSKVIGTFQDVTEAHHAQARMRELAFIDSVTGLPNRSYFMDRLREMLALAHRHDRKMALMFVDLDQFKRVNDSWGHHAGDQLLVQVSRRLSDSLRICDVVSRFGQQANAQIARLGGDEFVVLLSEINQPEDTAIIAKRLAAELKKPFEIEGTEVHISASIGISCFPNDGVNEQELLRHADIAMYQVKEQGRNGFRFYEAGMNTRTIERLNMENSLRRALDQNEFEVHYQPIISGAGLAVKGAEALVRWRHPEIGIVAPGEFIHIAEECGLIIPLGNWVLNQTCKQLTKWAGSVPDNFQISVNTSPVQFGEQEYLQTIKDTLREENTPPHKIRIEITESMLMDDTQRSLELLAELRKMGVQIAIDDFGTGYSSLSYLKHLPIDSLKIDRSFVRDMAIDKRDVGIISATIALAHHLDLNVIAEGVEREEHLTLLQNLDCDDFQGYYFCPALPADEFMAWVESYSIKPIERVVA